MRNMLAIPAFAFLYLLGTEATAQDCGEVCTWDFWESSTQQEVEEAIRNVNVNARAANGAKPLYYAAGEGTSEAVTILLEAGADLNTRTEMYQTPLHYAARFGTPETVTILLDAGADAAMKDVDGKTPFDLAEENEDLKGTDTYWALNDARFK
jgi:cytohesin